jgi:hypothetical protein
MGISQGSGYRGRRDSETLDKVQSTCIYIPIIIRSKAVVEVGPDRSCIYLYRNVGVAIKGGKKIHR